MVDGAQVEDAVRTLHDAFGLAEARPPDSLVAR
ncbi:MAG: hypothetical protein Ct9H300mP12_07990 [Acidimicrobiales bacterium]|nr:MAG: hypothetical protein Ct9H300mP12_07990 [Acidimicrobiales bacterium]